MAMHPHDYPAEEKTAAPSMFESEGHQMLHELVQLTGTTAEKTMAVLHLAEASHTDAQRKHTAATQALQAYETAWEVPTPAGPNVSAMTAWR